MADDDALVKEVLFLCLFGVEEEDVVDSLGFFTAATIVTSGDDDLGDFLIGSVGIVGGAGGDLTEIGVPAVCAEVEEEDALVFAAAAAMTAATMALPAAVLDLDWEALL